MVFSQSSFQNTSSLSINSCVDSVLSALDDLGEESLDRVKN